jgi:hypothetical protein
MALVIRSAMEGQVEVVAPRRLVVRLDKDRSLQSRVDLAWVVRCCTTAAVQVVGVGMVAEVVVQTITAAHMAVVAVAPALRYLLPSTLG